MKKLNLPYNFVPLSRAILHPAWADKVSHDHPFRDGLSGELTLRIINDTPLCAGGEQIKATKDKAGTICFFTDENDRPAIPGSTIKGMLRNVLEIATFGHFEQVDDVRMGVRDISESSNFYTELMDEKYIKAGWLNYNNGHWDLTPCLMERVEQREIIRHFEITEPKWNLKDREDPRKNNRTARARYRLLRGLREVGFYRREIDSEDENQVLTSVVLTDPKEESGAIAETLHTGFVVVTGQPGKDFNHPKAKQKDFIFHDPRENERMKVPDRVISDFMFIHQDSDEWRYWRNELEHNRAVPGVPVFFKQTPSGVHSMGLAMMYKLAYENSVHDAIANTNPAHVRATWPDLAQLMFGRVDESEPDGRNNLRGRINIGLARIDDPDNRAWKSLTDSLVLSSPKSTYYPAYIDQQRGGNTRHPYKTLMDSKAELSGWKRYPVRDDYQEPELTETVERNKEVQVRLQVVPPRSRFKTRVRFHNLLPAELGALLWSTNFGGAPQASHALGTGKPFGFGQVRLEAEAMKVVPNRDQIKDAVDDSDVADEMCRAAFIELMNDFWNRARSDQSEWIKSPQLVQLLAMADPFVGDREKEWNFPREPKEFADAKKGTDRFIRQPYVDPQEYESGSEARFGEYVVESPGAFRQRAQELAEEREEARHLEAELAKREHEKLAMAKPERALMELADLLSPDEWNASSFRKLDEHIRKQILASADLIQEVPRDKVVGLIEQAWSVVAKHDKQKDSVGKAVKKLKRAIDDKSVR
ncbi:MAG: TIGR03986 family CRISPR-associated RAMP protein [Wenzhouxiangellaceae bacterium]